MKKKQICGFCKTIIEKERESGDYTVCDKCTQDTPRRIAQLMKDTQQILDGTYLAKLKETKIMAEVKMGVVKTAGKEMQELLDCEPAVRFNKVGIKKAELLEDIKREAVEMEAGDEEDFSDETWAFLKGEGFLDHIYASGEKEEVEEEEVVEEEEEVVEEEEKEEVVEEPKKKPAKKSATKKPAKEEEVEEVVEEKKKPVKKEAKKPATPKVSRRAAMVQALKVGGTKTEQIEAANKIIVDAGGKDNMKETTDIYNKGVLFLKELGVISEDKEGNISIKAWVVQGLK